MGRFSEGCERRQRLLLPDCIDGYVTEVSPVRVVDMFVDELNLGELGFGDAAATGRLGYDPVTMLKLYIYGHLNQVQSSRRLERERASIPLNARGRWRAVGGRGNIAHCELR